MKPGFTLSRLPTWLRAAVPAVGLAVAVSSCLVASQQDFSDPAPTAPRLVANTARPPLDSLLVVQQGDTLHFRADVVSEDQQQFLYVRLVANSAQNDALLIQRVEPNEPGHQERQLAIDWNTLQPSVNGVVLQPGCYTLKLLVSHGFAPFQNVPNQGFPDAGVAPQDDADFLVWFVLITDPKDPASGSVPAVSCPSLQTATSP